MAIAPVNPIPLPSLSNLELLIYTCPEPRGRQLINDSFKTLQQIESAAFKWGTVLLVLSGSVLLFVWIGAIRPDAFGGYLKDGAFAVFAISCGLVVLSALRTGSSLLVRGLSYPFRVRAEAREKAQTLEKLRHNAFYLPDFDQLLLYAAYISPSHRVPMAIGYEYFRRLMGYNLLKYEAGSGKGFYSTETDILVLNSLIADDQEFWTEFRRHLTTKFGKSFTDDLSNLLERELKKASGY